MQNENRYNGWTNYATWRVNLELFDGINVADHFDAEPTLYELSQWAREWAREFVYNTPSDATIGGWAYAFLDGVNWREIAEHLLDYAKDCGAFKSEVEA